MRAVDSTSTERRAARHAAFRGRLLAAVSDLLADGGSYAELTVEQIAAATGTSRSTFYLHFRDKGHLLAEFVGDLSEDLLAVTWWSGDAPGGALRDHLHVILALYRRHAALLIAAADASSFDPAVRESFDGLLDAARAAFADHLRRGRDAGWAHSGVDPDDTAAWLIWMAERGMSRLAVGVDDTRLDELADSLLHIVQRVAYDA